VSEIDGRGGLMGVHCWLGPPTRHYNAPRMTIYYGAVPWEQPKGSTLAYLMMLYIHFFGWCQASADLSAADKEAWFSAGHLRIFYATALL